MRSPLSAAPAVPPVAASGPCAGGCGVPQDREPMPRQAAASRAAPFGCFIAISCRRARSGPRHAYPPAPRRFGSAITVRLRRWAFARAQLGCLLLLPQHRPAPLRLALLI